MATELANRSWRNPIGKQHYWHHSQALRHIYTASDTTEEEEVVLLTSAMMWLHDNIIYNLRTAVVHLQGFLRILTEYRMKRHQRGLPTTDFESQLLRGLVFRADVSDNAFAQVRDSDVIDRIRRRLRDSRYKDRFPTMRGVCDELRLGFTAIPHSCRTSSQNDQSRVGEEKCDDSVAITTTELRTYFEKWYCTFDAIPNSTPTNRILLECHYICSLLALQLHQVGSSTSIPVDDQQLTRRMQYVMGRLEELDMIYVQQVPGKEDVELPIYQLLAQMIPLTESADIRTRAYNYLRRIKRVEGLWSTDMVVDMMWSPYPPDGSSRPPPRFGNFNSPLKDTLPQTLTTAQASDSLESTQNVSSQYSTHLQAHYITTVSMEKVVAETTLETQTMLSGTSLDSNDIPQARSANGKLDVRIARADFQQSHQGREKRPEENYGMKLLKSGKLITELFPENTTWARYVIPNWSQIRAEEHVIPNSGSN